VDRHTRLGQHREAEVFALSDRSVLKLMRGAGQLAAVERESTALNAIAGEGGLVPRVRRLVMCDGRPGLVLGRVNGPDLMTLVATRPWLLRRAGQVLAGVQARLHNRARFSAGIEEEVGPLTAWLRARYRNRLPRSAGGPGRRWSRSRAG
jgi:hypothetical protein